MKFKIQAALIVLVAVSLACGDEKYVPPPPSPQPPIPLSPLPTPTFIPLPTKTSLPPVNIHVETVQLTPEQLTISGQLSGIPAETAYQSQVALDLFDSSQTIQGGQAAACDQPPHTEGAICAFTLLVMNPPASAVSYSITARVYSQTAFMFTGQTGGALPVQEMAVNATALPEIPASPSLPPNPSIPQNSPIQNKDFTLSIQFPSEFYLPENGASIDVTSTYFEAPTALGAASLELCATITEQRRYESGQTAEVVLSEGCKPITFTGSQSTAHASAKFLFTPSGYGYVWTNGTDGRYQITQIFASAALLKDRESIKTAVANHLPVPARVTGLSWASGNQANASVVTTAGEGETYTITLKVYQVEGDPDEIFWSFFLLFTPCLVPEICDDRTNAGESIRQITLSPGAETAIATAYNVVPVKEEGNYVTGYEMVVFFEDKIIGRQSK